MPVNVPTSNLAYYAANAPETIPDFFDEIYVTSGQDPATPDPGTLPPEDRADGQSYLAGGGVSPYPSEALQAFMVSVDMWNAQKSANVIANHQEKYFQWRWYYAKRMLKLEPRS